MTPPDDELIDIDLTNTERELMVIALNDYAGTAQQGFELLGPIVGKTSEEEWGDYVFPLKEAIKRKQPLSDLDWARALFLTEVGFASDLVGSGRRFGRRADEFWIVELRSLQDKITNYHRYTLLRDNAAYPAATRPPSTSDTRPIALLSAWVIEPAAGAT